MEYIYNIYGSNNIEIKAEKCSVVNKAILAQNLLKAAPLHDNLPSLTREDSEWDNSGKCHTVQVNVMAESGSTLNLHFLNALNNEGVINYNIDVTVQDNCNVTLSMVSVSGKNVDANIHINIAGENSTVNLPGLMLPAKDESFAYKSNVVHSVGHSSTTQKVRTVADHNGYGDFYGIIKVNPDAQKSVTEQVNNNILLSADARIESKPQLEIYADDVKCAHGSTTGMLDQEAIFYMRSRGISEKKAQNLLLQAFVDEILDNISDDETYINFLKNTIEEKLAM